MCPYRNMMCIKQEILVSLGDEIRERRERGRERKREKEREREKKSSLMRESCH
jgi:hypothetical protein